MQDERELANRVAAAVARRNPAVVFGVPGGGANLDVVGAFGDLGIDFVLAHSEASACIMAATYGYCASTVSAAIVTRGPGATAAANGVAQATLDRHPLVVISDTVPSSSAERVAHQQLDQTQLMEPITKASVRIGPNATDDDLSYLVNLADESPAGAVHIDYDASFGDRPELVAPADQPSVAETNELEMAQELIEEAAHPVVIVGVLANNDATEVRRHLEDFGAPVLSTYQGMGVVDSEHRLHAGIFTNGASERALLQQADLIVSIGLDVVEPIPAPWAYDAPVLSLSPVPTTVPYMPVACELVGPLADTLAVLSGPHDWPSTTGSTHQQRVRDTLRQSAPDFGPTALVDVVAKHLPHAIATVDAGAHFLAVMPLWPTSNSRELLISNGLATMGYAIPAAIGASLANPDRTVVAFVGDGGLSMTLAELETISRRKLPIITVVFNDSALSLIEIKQRTNHGGEGAVRYLPTDFATIAGGLSMAAVVVNDVDSLDAALAGHDQSDGPLLIDARIDPSHYPHLIEVTRG